MTVRKGKRPRDPNQLVNWIVERSTDESTNREEQESPSAPTQPTDLSAYMAAIGRKGGLIGGKRPLKTMKSAERRKIASKAAKTCWKGRRKRQP